MDDYVSEQMAGALGRPLHRSWTETTRERIAYVAPDDDINYTRCSTPTTKSVAR